MGFVRCAPEPRSFEPVERCEFGPGSFAPFVRGYDLQLRAKHIYIYLPSDLASAEVYVNPDRNLRGIKMDGEHVEPAEGSQKIIELMKRPDRIRLDWLQQQFPEDFQAICDLGPLRANPNLTPFLVQFTALVYLCRAKYENVQGAEQAARDLDKGIANIRQAIQGFAHINYFRLGAFLAQTSDRCARLKGLDANEVLELLDDFCILGSALSEVMRSASNVSLVPRRRGDKRAYYFVPTIALIELWESKTATQQEGTARRSRRGVPTPKKAPKGDDCGKKLTSVSKQPSTEFIRHALRMIEPRITDAQVFTAIKTARKMRDALCSRSGRTSLFDFDQALNVLK